MARSKHDQYLHVYYENDKEEVPAVGKNAQYEGQKARIDQDICGN